MTPLEIKIELMKKGITQRDIAKSFTPPVNPSAVFHVIHKTWVSKRIMQAVADKLGRDIKYVFPEYFFKKSA